MNETATIRVQCLNNITDILNVLFINSTAQAFSHAYMKHLRSSLLIWNALRTYPNIYIHF